MSTKQPSLPSNVKGKDLFDSRLWADPISTSVFYRFISSLREQIKKDIKNTTPTHRFIRTLRDRRKLVRCYTQNIDGLEGREGLSTGLALGRGNRQRFTKKSMVQPMKPMYMRPGGDLDGGCEVVQLHGDLESLRCTLCQQTCEWEEQHGQHNKMLLAGTAPLCNSCVAKDQERQDRGKRGTKIGTLRPNIVLYGEDHPAADVLGSISTHDLGLSPDVLLILGSSLHVHGLKTMVREFAKSVHARPGGKGKVVFVNLSKPSESVWKDVLDYWVPMDCDAWVNATRAHRPDLFQIQEELKMPVKKAIGNQEKKKPVPWTDMTENKENIVANSSASQSQSKPSKPQVVVPVTPRKKKPFQDCEANIVSPRLVNPNPERLAVRDSQEPPISSLQLPTPPSSKSTDSIVSSTKKRRRTLAETYNEIVQTPLDAQESGSEYLVPTQIHKLSISGTEKGIGKGGIVIPKSRSSERCCHE